MIEVKLKEIAKKLGKNISQIAEDTGLNRNTVTAIYHGKVDGIKFATLEKICEAFRELGNQVTLADIPAN